MNYSEFLPIYFSNLTLFLFSGMVCILLCFYSVKKISIAGILDPIHFYWTYTFGTTYSIILGLYYLNMIDTYIVIIVAMSGLILICSLHVGRKFNINFIKLPLKIINSRNDGHKIYKLSLIIMCFLYIIIIYKVGFGIFADVNRFQQNKGVGPLVRAVDALRLFVFSYGFIYIRSIEKRTTRYSLYIILLFLILVSSSSNGAKFALLEVLYSIILCYVIYSGKKLKLTLSKAISTLAIFSLAFIFSIAVINFSLSNTKNNTPQYLPPDTPIAIEKIFLRTLSNGDQAYLGLPNNIIDKIEQGNIIHNTFSSLFGKNLYRELFNYNDNLDNVGQKILKYHFPLLNQPGGPVSHFDLYFYHYLPIGLNYLAIVFIGLLLSSIANCHFLAKDNLFLSAAVTTLWMKGLVMVLEPAMGLVYLADFFAVIIIIKLMVSLFKIRQ
ncbi:hypothetical protein [Morganella morganii]|uniref:hypothetical protein n=1 Tax=Morganella morganii TaxID=582 RepID=UPI002368185A|nr:hypothetical protein [Morganella morganii]